ncbi:MAG TPA: sigma-54 dependent transcriptional regulator [Alkalispirochaeta sp.]|nr:sigma-54 dependent transcriptional regulator [Alkalispirochaeta sp.]
MTVLVVDDEEGIRDILTDILTDEDHTVLTAGDGLVGLGMLEREVIDCVLLDVWLPGKGGLEVLEEIRDRFPRVPVIMISGHGTIDVAVKAVKHGAYDFLEKPLSLDRVVTVVRNALMLEELRRENDSLRTRVPAYPKLVGQSEALTRIREIVTQTADSDARVLITGENGTGKELVAREIHERSSRRDGPFVAVNCAAIPDSLIESELFGHEKGAFTGAAGSRKGKFELAHTGTLFLDEVADMSLNAQAKVLRAVQEMRFERVGSETALSVDVRIIAATNRDVTEAITDGSFREDLFFRLNVVPIHMPPLRGRTDDIPLLLRAFDPDLSFDHDALEALREHPWPGNVRELKNFVERVSIMTESSSVTRDEVIRFLGRKPVSATSSPLDEYLSLGLSEAKDRFERQFLSAKLREHEFNISRTAQELGVYPSNLHAKIKKFGIEVKR